jgi:hypothetical protein
MRRPNWRPKTTVSGDMFTGVGSIAMALAASLVGPPLFRCCLHLFGRVRNVDSDDASAERPIAAYQAHARPTAAGADVRAQAMLSLALRRCAAASRQSPSAFQGPGLRPPRASAWVLNPPNELPGSMVAQAFRSHGLKFPQPSVVSFSLHMRSRMLATGRYLSVVPGSLLQFTDLPSPFKILPVKLAMQTRPVAIVALKERTLGPIARLFIDCAQEVTKSLRRHQVSCRIRSVCYLHEAGDCAAWHAARRAVSWRAHQRSKAGARPLRRTPRWRRHYWPCKRRGELGNAPAGRADPRPLVFTPGSSLRGASVKRESRRRSSMNKLCFLGAAALIATAFLPDVASAQRGLLAFLRRGGARWRTPGDRHSYGGPRDRWAKR